MVTFAPRTLVALSMALVLVASACANPVIPEVAPPATPTPTPGPTPTPVATVLDEPTPTPLPFEGEPGVTADTIRVGVIYDVGVNPIADQLSRSALEAVQAWAVSLGDAGLAGRTVEVVPIETRPVLQDHAEAIDFACNSGIFALVGSNAIFDGEGLDQLESPACGLPDFPSVTSSAERLGSPLTTVSNPITSDLWQAGWASYFVGAEPEAAGAAAAMFADFQVSRVNAEHTVEAARAQGYEFVSRNEIAFGTDLTQEVSILEDAGAQLLTWRSDGGRLLDLLGALDDAETSLTVVDCAQACYSDTWVDAAGATGEGVSVWLSTSPLEESDEVSELLRYLFWNRATTGVDADETSVGILAWASALLFEEAVNISIGVGTSQYNKDDLTRTGVLAAASTITTWDARGLHGPSNPAGGIPSACFVLLTLSDGAWERTFPERRGQLDCAEENLVPLTTTVGLVTAPTPTPEPTPDPAAEPDEGDG